MCFATEDEERMRRSQPNDGSKQIRRLFRGMSSVEKAIDIALDRLVRAGALRALGDRDRLGTSRYRRRIGAVPEIRSADPISPGCLSPATS